MQRQTITRESLKGALVQLLQKKTFETITISDLCRTAGINRTTFYLHYIDKFDFVEQLKEEQVQRFFSILQDSPNAVDALQTILNTLYEEGIFFKTILQSSFANFSETLHDVIQKIIQQDAHAEYFISEYYKNIPATYANELFISSVQGIILYWIANDFPESPNTMLSILLKIPVFQWWTKD